MKSNSSSRAKRGWVLLAIAALAAVQAWDSAPQAWLRLHLFDAYQRLLPRERISAPGVVVEIDEESLAAYGQWPWPRTRLAELIEKIAAAGPAAVGVDIVMPEPDRSSPRRIAETVTGLDSALAAKLAELPDNDEVLARAMRGRPVVQGLLAVNAPAAAGGGVRAPPLRSRGGGDALAVLHVFPAVLHSRPEIEAAAAGLGLLNAEPEAGLVRRMLLLARVGNTPVPGLAVELLRVASDTPVLDAIADERGLAAVAVGDLVIPTAPDGRVWLHYGRWNPGRYVSAQALLADRVDASVFERKLVLIALTGAGLVDWLPTPLGERVPGAEVHLQLLEAIFDGRFLRRPAWARWAELGTLLVFAAFLVAIVPLWTPRRSFLACAAMLAALAAAGIGAFHTGLLLDAASPALALAAVLALALGTTLTEAQQQRRELARRLQEEREAAARLAGEMQAAQRVQMGMLPASPGLLPEETRVQAHAFMVPARTVGGDLYDFFLQDERRLFVLIGDVSGKGLPAAMFMALVKTLCKSAALREGASPAAVLEEAEGEIARFNSESLFVSLFALRLDLATGQVEYCNAGHDPPYALLPSRGEALRFGAAERPPLCVLEGQAFATRSYQLSPGESLCLITDGVTDAEDRQGERFGRQRLEPLLAQLAGQEPLMLAHSIKYAVDSFSAGAEQADDLTVVILKWLGETAVV